MKFSEGERYYQSTEGDDYCAIIDGNLDEATEHLKLRFGIVRRRNLPDVENEGSLTPLQLDPGAGLFEPIHIVFSPSSHSEHFLVGAEFNYYGPRFSRFAVYLQLKSHIQNTKLKVEKLVNRDVQQQLRKMGDVKKFRMKLYESPRNIRSRSAQNVFEMLDAARDALGGELIHLEVGVRPESGNILRRGRNFIRAITGSRDFQERFQVLQADAMNEETHLIEPFDLLQDKLISVKSVIRPDERYRKIDTESMYRAIEEAYGDLRDDLEGATGLLDAQN